MSSYAFSPQNSISLTRTTGHLCTCFYGGILSVSHCYCNLFASLPFLPFKYKDKYKTFRPPLELQSFTWDAKVYCHPLYISPQHHLFRENQKQIGSLDLTKFLPFMKRRELLDSIQVSISIIITTSSLFPGAQTYCFLLCTDRLRRLQPSSSHLTYKGTFTIHITIALSPSS